MSDSQSSNQRVSDILRSVIENGHAWPSAGIIGAAANLLDDVSLLLGRLAECFADDEQEFADIKLIRDRLFGVDSRERHVATDESARRHAHETDSLQRFAEWAAGAACDDEYAPRMVKHIAAIAKDALAGNADIAGYPTGISSSVETPPPVHADPTGRTREPPHCPSCSCGMRPVETSVCRWLRSDRGDGHLSAFVEANCGVSFRIPTGAERDYKFCLACGKRTAWLGSSPEEPTRDELRQLVADWCAHTGDTGGKLVERSKALGIQPGTASLPGKASTSQTEGNTMPKTPLEKFLEAHPETPVCPGGAAGTGESLAFGMKLIAQQYPGHTFYYVVWAVPNPPPGTTG